MPGNQIGLSSMGFEPICDISDKAANDSAIKPIGSWSGEA